MGLAPVMEIKGPLSEHVLANLIRWQYNDDISDKIDQISLTFNASKLSSLPDYGSKYQLSIHGVARGEWEIIEKSIDHYHVMSLKLSNVSKSGKVKEKATIAFNDKTIKDVVTETVSPCGYSADIGAEFASKVVNAFRANETVGDFLRRLAQDYGAVSKPFDGVWYFNSRHKVKNQAGNDKPALNLTLDDNITKANLIEAGDQQYQGVRVTYWSNSEQIEKALIKGEAPYNDLGKVSEAKAMDILNIYTRYNENAVKRVTVSLSTKNIKLGKAFAEAVLNLDLGRFIKGAFIIDSVSMSDKETIIQASKPNE